MKNKIDKTIKELEQKFVIATAENNIYKDFVLFNVKGLIKKPELMPQSLEEYVGQERIKSLISDATISAQKQNRALPHMLLSGFPGMGKTTMAYLISSKINRPLIAITGISLTNVVDVNNLFKSIEKMVLPIIFIDEIHSIKSSIAEIFYQPMEIPNTQITTKDMFGNRKVTINVPPMTIIGATAGDEGKMPKPFFDRFDIKLYFDKYPLDDMMSIIRLSTQKLKLEMSDELIFEVVKRCSFVPRIANNILKRVRDYVVANNVKNVELGTLVTVFDRLSIDECGIDKIGMMILQKLSAQSNGMMGIRSLSNSINMNEMTIKSAEIPLLAHGFMDYSNKGRFITEQGLAHLQKIYQVKSSKGE